MRVGGRDQESSFGNIECEMSIKHPPRGIWMSEVGVQGKLESHQHLGDILKL